MSVPASLLVRLGSWHTLQTGYTPSCARCCLQQLSTRLTCPFLMVCVSFSVAAGYGEAVETEGRAVGCQTASMAVYDLNRRTATL